MEKIFDTWSHFSKILKKIRKHLPIEIIALFWKSSLYCNFGSWLLHEFACCRNQWSMDSLDSYTLWSMWDLGLSTLVYQLSNHRFSGGLHGLKHSLHCVYVYDNHRNIPKDKLWRCLLWNFRFEIKIRMGFFFLWIFCLVFFKYFLL